jgi:hypothetical protein
MRFGRDDVARLSASKGRIATENDFSVVAQKNRDEARARVRGDSGRMGKLFGGQIRVLSQKVNTRPQFQC